MKHLKPGDIGFNTSNAILAYCLHLAGVPWESEKLSVTVMYSPALLANFKNGDGKPFYEGWEYEKAVEHAHKTGRRGHVEYRFKRTERLSKLLKAYRDQCNELESKDGFLHEFVADLAAQLSELEPDVAMVRLACVFMQKRMDFMEMWQHQIPLLIYPNQGRVRRTREIIDTKYGPREAIVIASPGMKIMSLNASKETRKHLGLP